MINHVLGHMEMLLCIENEHNDIKIDLIYNNYI